MIDRARSWHAFAVAPRLRFVSACLICLCACAEESISASGDEGPEDELPQADCSMVPTVLDSPIGGWVEAEPDPALTDLQPAAVLPGGDLVWLMGHARVIRWNVDGQQLWIREAEDGEVFSHLGVAATGAIVVGGHYDSDDPLEPGKAMLLLMRLDGDGNVEQREIIDVPDHETELVGALAVTPAGDTIAEISLLGVPETTARLARFDGDLSERWSIESESVFELAIDVDGNIYTAQMDLIEGEALDYLWNATVTARTSEGELAWVAEVEVPSSGLPSPQLSISDRVYMLTPGFEDSRLFAFELDGELAWEHDFYAGDLYHHVAAIAASPCGGVYLGGRTSVPMLGARASLASMDAAGSLGPIVPLVDELPDDYFFDATTHLAVSPLGQVVASGELRRPSDENPDRAWMKAY
jgi:hypothetical protein